MVLLHADELSGEVRDILCALWPNAPLETRREV